MFGWWDSLTLIEQIFALVAVPSTLILLIQTAMLIIGLSGMGGNSDLESDTSGLDGDGIDLDGNDVPDMLESGQPGEITDVGMRLFTVRGFISFFTIFGWLGLICIQSGMPSAASVLVASTGGGLSMFLTAFIMKSAMRLQVNGTINLANAVGKTATVYIRVPAMRSERGKVSLVVQERLIEADAVTDEQTDLNTGCEVVVVGMSGQNSLIVSRKNWSVNN